MSFEQFEDSTEGGTPIELYEFYYQGQITRWTSYDRSVIVNLLVYTAASIVRSDIEDAGKNVANPNVTLTVEPNFAPAMLFSVCPPSDVVNILIKRVHKNDMTDPKVIYGGRVLNVAWPQDQAKITCQSIFTRLKQPGLRRLYGKACSHLLYSQGEGMCNADPVAFKETITIGGVSGIIVQAADFATFPDDYFRGGKLDVEITPGVFERRGIQAHTGDTITLTHPLPGLVGLMLVDVYPGCDKTQATCVAKFNNVVNFGGFPYVPTKNPFGPSTVF